MKRLIASLLLAVLVGCASAPPVDTFNKRLLVGYSTVTAVDTTAAQLRAAGKLSNADRDNVVATSRTAIEALDLAARTEKTDPAAGDAKLQATLTVLTALQSYLASKGAQP